MEQAIRQNTQADFDEPSVPGVSWAAVLAGAVASLALTLVLLSFGAGMGFAVISPWGNSGVSATTFKIGTGLYFIVMAMISSAIGGYLAGRLRTKWVGVQTTEVHFRDTAHGLLAWAAASVLGAVLLASPASSLIGATLSGATQAAANSAQSSPMDGYVDTLLRSDNASAQGQQNSSDTRGEMARLFTSSFHNGDDLKPADRTYVAKVVSARTGLNQADAEKRVNDVVTQVKTDLDAARKVAMQIAIWLTLSLFIGAFSASLAATEGGGLRDGTWGKKAYGGTLRSIANLRKRKEIHDAHSALARRDSDPADHSHHAAPLSDAVSQRHFNISNQGKKHMTKYLAAALLTTALFTCTASAQTASSKNTDSAVSAHQEGQWRASKLVGVDVYNEANEKIGDINEIILDKSGKAANVILGVGGFLGMGEHYVAVAYDKLKWVNEPVRTSATTPTTDKPTVGVNNAGAATGEVNRSNRPVRAANENWYPDHVVFNATKDQLKAMPQFKY